MKQLYRCRGCGRLSTKRESYEVTLGVDINGESILFCDTDCYQKGKNKFVKESNSAQEKSK